MISFFVTFAPKQQNAAKKVKILCYCFSLTLSSSVYKVKLTVCVTTSFS